MKQAVGVQKALGLTQKELADILHVSTRTLQRYSEDEVLNPALSEKIFMLGSLNKHGISFFEGRPEVFQHWLRSKIGALNFEEPISYLDTVTGIKEIDNILGRIEHFVIQ